MRTLVCAIAFATGAAAPFARAEVVKASETGFVTQSTASVKAGPEFAWDMLVQPARWWNPDHSWSLDGNNFRLEPVAGGCFCETLPGGGSVEHMRVIQAVPGKMLRMSGALGPLQSEAYTGTLTIELDVIDGATQITWTYVVAGYGRYPLDQLAAPVDGVQAEQLERLANLLETGSPTRAEQAGL